VVNFTTFKHALENVVLLIQIFQITMPNGKLAKKKRKKVVMKALILIEIGV